MPEAKKVFMIVTLPFVVCIYLGMMIYPVWRTCMLGVRGTDYSITSTKDDPNWTWIFAIVLSVFVSAGFLLGMRFPNKHRIPAAMFRYFFRVANYFLGFLIVLLPICVVYEIVAGITYGASHKKTTLYSGEGARISFIVILAVWFVAVVIGMVNTFVIGVKNLTVESPKLKQKARITHISDIHMGSRARIVMRHIISVVKKQNPDIVVITGDLFDIKPVTPDHFNAFKELSCPVYYVLGNHEQAAGSMDEIMHIYGWFKDNVTLLINQSVDLEGKMEGVEIIGVKDPESSEELTGLYNTVTRDDNKFRVLLCHRPHPLSNTLPSDAMPELYLSGHTHGGGQFLIFTPFVKLAFPLMNGEYRNMDGSPTVVYTSPGTGIWGPPIKHYARTLVANIDLIPSQ